MAMQTSSRSPVQCVDVSSFERAEMIHSSAIPINRRNAAGKTTVQGAIAAVALASASIEPMVAVVTGTPQPRNDREDSESIEERNTETD